MVECSNVTHLMCDIQPKVKNIKIHFKVREKFKTLFLKNINELKDVTIYHGNFGVIKKNTYLQNKYTYIFFPDCGYINVTGLPNYSSLAPCVLELTSIFGLRNHELSPPRIDNITASGNFFCSIDLETLAQQLLRESFFCFRTNQFPGLIIRAKNGTILVFNSGKYTIVGLKCISHGIEMIQQVSAVMRNVKITMKDF